MEGGKGWESAALAWDLGIWNGGERKRKQSDGLVCDWIFNF